MSRFVDAAVIPVPSDALEDYREVADRAGECYVEHGALSYFEGTEAPTEAEPDGPGQGFAALAGAGADETVVVAVIAFESRAHRDEVTEAVMDDPDYQALFGDEMPFDPSRMSTGSFSAIVSYEA